MTRFKLLGNNETIIADHYFPLTDEQQNLIMEDENVVAVNYLPDREITIIDYQDPDEAGPLLIRLGEYFGTFQNKYQMKQRKRYRIERLKELTKSALSFILFMIIAVFITWIINQILKGTASYIEILKPSLNGKDTVITLLAFWILRNTVKNSNIYFRSTQRFTMQLLKLALILFILKSLMT